MVGIYPKSTTPARPESTPATAASSSGPPPAHSGAGARGLPMYLPPPPPALSYNTPVRQPLSAPTLMTSSAQSPDNEQPLDLGAPTKRKVVEDDEVPPAGGTPAKTVKLEPQEGQLFKVSEPSVLVSSEASNITAVENMAIKKEEPGEVGVAQPKQESPEAEPKYVHKLKKAWIKQYEDPTPAKKPSISSENSAPSTPSNTRATPSPALSNTSERSKGHKKVNGHAKMDESESSDSSVHKTHKESGVPSARGKGRAGRGGGRGPSRGRAKASDLSDSDDKDSDATTSSRRSTATSGSTKGRRGRKPKRGGATSGTSARKNNNSNDEEKNEENGRGDHKNGRDGLKKSADRENSNPFNNPPVMFLKKTGESFLQDSDCFKVAPKLAKCRECKWSQHNKNAGSSASIFCR